MKHVLSLALMLAALWWCLSGHTEPLLLALGLASTLFTVLLARRLDLVDHESHPLHITLPLLAYWMRLAGEVLKSSAQVVAMILGPGRSISPRFIRVAVGQPSALGRVILGNSITLTPGTVTVLVNGGEFLVHALSAETAEGVVGGDLDRLIPANCEGPG